MKKFLLVVLALMMAPAAFAQGTYQIRPGDVLDITVLEDSNLNRQVLVRPDGGISMPIAGNVQAAGQSIAAVERVLVERLAGGFSITPTVSVALREVGTPVATGSFAPATVDVFLIGQVNKPGAMEVARGSTVLQVLSAAGGLDRFAATKRVQVRRTDSSGHETVYLFNYDAVERGGKITNNLVVADGDVIVVPERKLFE